MKIAYIFPSNLICGGHIEALQHITRLQDRGYSVFICLLDENIPADPNSFSWFPGFTGQVCHLSNFPKDTDISVATFWNTALVSLQLPSKYKVYFVQCDERQFYNEPLLRSRVALTYLCNFIFMTEAKWVVNWLKRDFGHNAFYIPKGIDTNLMNSEKCIEPRSPNKFRVLIEGSIDSPFKRVKESIDACQNLDCEVWCVSNKGIESFSSKIKIDRFFYQVPFHKMSQIYSSCDILLKLSSVEGVFAPPLEMMACGGVPIVSDVSGYDEYIIHEYNALVVPNGDVDLARQALKRLMEDKNLYLKLQANGLKTAMERDWNQSIDKLEMIFIELLDSHPITLSTDTFEDILNIDNTLNKSWFLENSKVGKLANLWFKLRNQ